MNYQTVTIALDLPEDLAQAVRAFGPVEWGAVRGKTRQQHFEDFGNTLRLTMEHFNLPDDAPLHGLYRKGTEDVHCHTGTSPSAPQRARILDGMWNALYETLIAQKPYLCQCADVPGNDKPIHRDAGACEEARKLADAQPAKDQP